MSCSFCGEGAQKRINCGTCAGFSSAKTRMGLIKTKLELFDLQEKVDRVLNDPKQAFTLTSCGASESRTGRLDAKVLALQLKLDQLKRATLQCHAEVNQIREKARKIKTDTATAAKSTAALRKSFTNEKNMRIQHERESIITFEKTYMDLFQQTLPLQSACCESLLDLFLLKKKRRKTHDYDVVLAFNTIPEFLKLGHYPVAVINAGIERLSYFIVLLASYLGVHLPYTIYLPTKSFAYVRIGPLLKELYLGHSVKTTMRTTPREFHNYCGSLAMVALNVAFVAARIGVVNLGFESITRPNFLVAQLYLKLESYIKHGKQVQVHAVSLATDTELIKDHFISSIDVDLNGHSAEWNIVEAPEDLHQAQS